MLIFIISIQNTNQYLQSGPKGEHGDVGEFGVVGEKGDEGNNLFVDNNSKN